MPVVEYFHQVEAAGADRSFASVLQGLAQLLAADAIGLSPLDRGAPDMTIGLTPGQGEEYPWRTDATLLDRLYASRSAETVESDGGAWLICVIWEPVRVSRACLGASACDSAIQRRGQMVLAVRQSGAGPLAIAVHSSGARATP